MVGFSVGKLSAKPPNVISTLNFDYTYHISSVVVML